MSKRKRSDDHNCGAAADSTNLEVILSQLEAVHAQAAELDRSLQSRVTEDSSFVSWRSYAERLRLDVPEANKSRLLSQQLCTTVAELLKTLRPTTLPKKRCTTLVDEVFVDIFVYLSRYYLVAVQHSNRRFRDIVTTHLATSCLRTVNVEFLDTAQAEEFDEIWRSDQPNRGGAHAGIYRLEIKSYTQDGTKGAHKFIFEDKNAKELLVKFQEKLSGAVYVRYFGIHGMTRKLSKFLRRNDIFKRITVGSLWLIARDEELSNRPQLASAQISSFLRMFESVKDLNVIDRGVSDDFLKECRSAGVVNLLVNDEDEDIHTFTVKGVIDFCFGSTLPGQEKFERRISGLWFPALDVFPQLLEASSDAGDLEHVSSVELSEAASRPLQRDELEEELCKRYKSDYVAGTKLENEDGHRFNPRGRGSIYWYLTENKHGGFALEIMHEPRVV